MKKYQWINMDIKIDFPIPKSIQGLIDELEKMDLTENYAYFNYAEALDDGAKNLVAKGVLTQQQWDLLSAKYLCVGG